MIHKKYYKHIVLSIGSLIAVFIGIGIMLQTRISTEQNTLPPHKEISVKSDFTSDIYFNNTPEDTIIIQHIVPLIDKTLQHIDIAMYNYDHKEVVDALNRAKERGVQIRFLTDNKRKGVENMPHKRAMRNYDLSFAEAQKDSMHHKFMILDNSILITGALNFTTLQELYDPSYIMITRDKALLEGYKMEFERIINGHQGSSKYALQDYNPHQYKIHYTNGYISLWLSPGLESASLEAPILDNITSAEHTIDILLWQFNSYTIAEELINTAKKGIQVRIIVDDFYKYSQDSVIQYITTEAIKQGITTLSVKDDKQLKTMLQTHIEDDFNPFLHHHMMIVDGKKVLTGTANWTYRGFQSNDENTIETDIMSVVQPLYDTFEYWWKVL